MNYKLSTPALNGETVTQGHADYCATNGHMTHTVDGVDQGFCPRCGESTMVKIEMRTETNGERGMIVTEAQPRSRAIRVLAETFDLSEAGWMFNTQAKITGDTLWQWTLVKA